MNYLEFAHLSSDWNIHNYVAFVRGMKKQIKHQYRTYASLYLTQSRLIFYCFLTLYYLVLIIWDLRYFTTSGKFDLSLIWLQCFCKIALEQFRLLYNLDFFLEILDIGRVDERKSRKTHQMHALCSIFKDNSIMPLFYSY